MTQVFGSYHDRSKLTALVPDLTKIVGIRQFREENGAGAGQRVLQIQNGGGLTVELLPDRTCDIGQVWMGATPFGWISPIGTANVSLLRGNQSLSGLMATCGFDHIRQPESDGGCQYRLHGSMVHQPAVIVFAGPVWADDACILRVVCEATQFHLDRGGMRLKRTIDVPMGGNSLSIRDEVTVLARPQPVMAMYHVNLGFPVAGPDSQILLNGSDITEPHLGRDDVVTRPAGPGWTAVSLAADDSDDAPCFELGFDAADLPVFQTLRDSTPGINLTCLEPASHDRQPRGRLREAGALQPADVGTVHRFKLEMTFHDQNARK